MLAEGEEKADVDVDDSMVSALSITLNGNGSEWQRKTGGVSHHQCGRYMYIPLNTSVHLSEPLVLLNQL